MDEKRTTFQEVYQVFLASVDSYDFAQIDEFELEQLMFEYLKSALYLFVTYHKDLADYDEEQMCFNMELNKAEISMIAKAMKLQWVSTNKHSEELMRKAIGDRDYNAVQGYRYLESLGVMEKQLRREIENWINTYEYSLSDLYGAML